MSLPQKTLSENLEYRALYESRFLKNFIANYTFPRASISPNSSQASGSVSVAPGRALLCSGVMISADGPCRVFGVINEVELVNEWGVHQVDPNTGEAVGGGYEVMFGPEGGSQFMSFGALPHLIRELGGVTLRYMATTPDQSGTGTAKTVNVSAVLMGSEITNSRNPNPEFKMLVVGHSLAWSLPGKWKPGMEPDLSLAAGSVNPDFLGEVLWPARVEEALNLEGISIGLVNKAFGGSEVISKQFRTLMGGFYSLEYHLLIVTLGANDAKEPMTPQRQLVWKQRMAQFIRQRDAFAPQADIVLCSDLPLDDASDNLNERCGSRNNRDRVSSSTGISLMGFSTSTAVLDAQGASSGTVFKLGTNSHSSRVTLTGIVNGVPHAEYVLEGRGPVSGSGACCAMQRNNQRKIRSTIYLTDSVYLRVRMDANGSSFVEIERGNLLGLRIPPNATTLALSGLRNYTAFCSPNTQPTVLTGFSGLNDQDQITLEGSGGGFPTQIVPGGIFELKDNQPMVLNEGQSIVFGVQLLGSRLKLIESHRGSVVPQGQKTRIRIVRDLCAEVATSAHYGGGEDRFVYYADLSNAFALKDSTVDPVTGLVDYAGNSPVTGQPWVIGDEIDDPNFKWVPTVNNERLIGHRVHLCPEGHRAA
ncbi:hypothetical protein GC167_05715 [bacterium]|nr:hypothetical protein [bacterium]